MNKALEKKIVQVDGILTEMYGSKVFKSGADPLTELVLTILSQNTNDTNRDRAFRGLKDKYPYWDDLLTASPKDVEKVIKVGGLAKIKSGRIIKMLKSIKKSRGQLSLEFLSTWPDDQIREYLLQIDGVGPKTAACVLAFSLGRDVMPVDTHVHRVSSRLGILPEKITPDKAHKYFLDFRGMVSLYQFHLNLIALGRNICKAQKPLCDNCRLRSLCRYYVKVVKMKEKAA